MTTKAHTSRPVTDGGAAGSPLRATMGGLSILLVVALALQAGVGVRVDNAPCNDARAAQARVVQIVPTLVRQEQRPDPTDASDRLFGRCGPVVPLAIGDVAGLACHAESTGAQGAMDWRGAVIARESSLPPPVLG